jgi:3'(2'), 5'-bisphosphate nucleotidase
LQRLAPHIPIVSEENVAVPYEVRKHYQYSWCVDPLDGTKVRSATPVLSLTSALLTRAVFQEFIKRNGQFTVNIALLRGGVPVLGVVHTPVMVRRGPLRFHLPADCVDIACCVFLMAVLAPESHALGG